MTLRLRLTLLYTGLLAIALVLFGTLTYGVLRWTYSGAVDDTLQRVASVVARSFQRQGMLPPLESLADRSTFVLVRGYDVVIDSSGNFSGIFPLPAEARNGTPTFTNESDRYGQPFRLYTLPFIQEGRPLFYVQVAYDLSLLTVVTNQLRIPLVLGTMIFLGLGALGAWLLARRAMAPIEGVVAAAREIGQSQDLSLRVPDDRSGDDEVGVLVQTFNDMLEQLQGLYGRLAASMDAQQRFVADASHELRTPLTIIRGNIDYLHKAGQLDSEALADMASEAERMTTLIEELLTMARADSGLAPELQPVNLGPLVREACRKAQALPHEADFRIELPDPLDRVVVLGNSEWLVRVLLILIDNAFKYTPAGSVTVRAGRQGAGVVVQVTDTGQGIAPDDLPHVFERFYRADKSRGRGGAGLGLAIARWIAGVHGGTLTVESELGRGSTFSLWLPLQRASIS